MNRWYWASTVMMRLPRGETESAMTFTYWGISILHQFADDGLLRLVQHAQQDVQHGHRFDLLDRGFQLVIPVNGVDLDCVRDHVGVAALAQLRDLLDDLGGL